MLAKHPILPKVCETVGVQVMPTSGKMAGEAWPTTESSKSTKLKSYLLSSSCIVDTVTQYKYCLWQWNWRHWQLLSMHHALYNNASRATHESAHAGQSRSDSLTWDDLVQSTIGHLLDTTALRLKKEKKAKSEWWCYDRGMCFLLWM